MSDVMDYGTGAVLIGTIATAVMDVCSVILSRVAGVPVPNYALVGRWVAHMSGGRFRHRAIAAAPAMPGEHGIGWVTHYLTGITFASLLLAIWGIDWMRKPTLAPALLVGLGTVLVPFLVMQPAMGAGIAARRTPDPGTARLRSLINHGFFALGLYLAGWSTSLLCAA